MRLLTAITSASVLALLAACGQNVGTGTDAAPVTLPTEADVVFGTLPDDAEMTVPPVPGDGLASDGIDSPQP